MKIQKLKLYTNQLEVQQKFYNEVLGFEIIESSNEKFKVNIGWSELTFEKTVKKHLYHYCYLIPNNKLSEAFGWLSKRVEIIEIEKGRKIQYFENWNADSFYFYDASGNIAEFIIHYDLENSTTNKFSASEILGISEIGLPSLKLEEINSKIEAEAKTKFWKGDLQRFGTNGSAEGKFLLINYKMKENWFPTATKITPQPFEAIILNNENEQHKIRYNYEELTICLIH